MRSDNPCMRECPDRILSCHSSCPKYKAFREQLERERKARVNEQLATDIQMERIFRTKKRTSRESKRSYRQ